MNQSSGELKTDFVAILLQSSIIAVALEILSESLKACIPSAKKKKKGANPVLDEVQADIIVPLRTTIKELSAAYAIPRPFDVSARVDELKTRKAEIESSLGFSLSPAVENHLNRKIDEIAKEEKLAIDRLNSMRMGLSKRLKELSANGVFSQ